MSSSAILMGVVEALCQAALILVVTEGWRVRSGVNTVVLNIAGIVETLPEWRRALFILLKWKSCDRCCSCCKKSEELSVIHFETC
jgi:hypothetical protein